MNIPTYKSGGFLVPQEYIYEVLTSDFKPSKYSWWQFWKKSKYKKDLNKWYIRFNKWSLTRHKI